MKAAILYGDRDMRFGEAPDPQIGPDEVLVAPAYAGICGTDQHIYRGEFHAHVRYPAILGHEFGGTVVEAGKDVRGWRTGDRVVVDPIISCGQCTPCLTGHQNVCRTLRLLGVDMDGGFGQYVAVPAHRLFALPDAVPMEYASMVEMYGLGCHILSRGRVQPGETVAILGAGKLGLSVLDVLCHSADPGLTIVADCQPFRLETARQLGADYTIDVASADPLARIDEITGGKGVDCVIECVGHYHEFEGQEPPLGLAARAVRPAGRVVACGLGEQLSPVHFKTLVFKEAEIIGSRVTLGEFPRAIRLLEKGLLHPKLLITHHVALGEATAAFAQVDREQADTIKVVLDIGK